MIFLCRGADLLYDPVFSGTVRTGGKEEFGKFPFLFRQLLFGAPRLPEEFFRKSFGRFFIGGHSQNFTFPQNIIPVQTIFLCLKVYIGVHQRTDANPRTNKMLIGMRETVDIEILISEPVFHGMCIIHRKKPFFYVFIVFIKERNRRRTMQRKMHFEVINRAFAVCIVGFVILFCFRISVFQKIIPHRLTVIAVKENVVVHHLTHSVFRIKFLKNHAFQRHMPDSPLI